jgi:hypothetical protein
MSKQLTRIAPWQAGKVCAVVYFIGGLIFAVILAAFALLAPPDEQGQQFPLGFAIAVPFIYGLGALIFVPIACWIYNFAAQLVGGLEVEVETRGG